MKTSNCILLLLIYILHISCNSSETNTPNLDASLETDVQYLALGDSYTIGQGVNITDRFPLQLSNLIETNDSLSVTTTIIATTGWRTDELITAMQSKKLGTYNFITLLIGVNNQVQATPFAQYETEFTFLLNKAINLVDNTPKKVVVLSIPDYSFTPFGQRSALEDISNQIDTYNNFAKQTTLQHGCQFLDITDITRKGLEQPELVTQDGLHPSGLAYEQFIARLYPLVRSELKD